MFENFVSENNLKLFSLKISLILDWKIHHLNPLGAGANCDRSLSPSSHPPLSRALLAAQSDPLYSIDVL